MAKTRHGFNRPLADPALPDVDALVAELRPSDPLLCLRPATIAAAARRFVGAFPGDVLYAVKCNPEPSVLRALWAGGVRHFDCASLAEVKLVRTLLPAAEIHFMHPVKARPAIAEAFDRWDVTDFALDSLDELAKIVQETVQLGLVGDPPAWGCLCGWPCQKAAPSTICPASSARRRTKPPLCCAPRGRMPPALA